MEDRNAAGSLIDFFSSPDFPRPGLASLEAESSVRVTSQFAVNQFPTTASKFVQLGEENQANQLTSTPVSLSKAEPETLPQDPLEDAQLSIPHWFLPNLSNAGAVLQAPEPVVGEPDFPGMMKDLLGTTPSFEGGGGSSSNGSSGMFGGAGFGPGGETGGGGEPGSGGGDPGNGGGSGGGGDHTFLHSPKVQSVTYLGENFIDIEADPGNPYEYPDPPHWMDLNKNNQIDLDVIGERALPIGYVRNDVPEVSATFTFETGLSDWPVEQKTPLVKASTSNSAVVPFYIQLQPTELLSIDGGFYLPPTKMDAAFPDYVNYGTMSMYWSVSLDGGFGWSPAGVTNNELYVTLDKASIPQPIPHTFIHISTQAGAGANNRKDFIENTWKNSFGKLQVYSAQSAPLGAVGGAVLTPPHRLHYYSEWDTKVLDAIGLLVTRDGQCGAWVDLYLNTLAANLPDISGKNAPDTIVHLSGKAAKDNMIATEQMVVANWHFANQSIINKDYNYANHPLNANAGLGKNKIVRQKTDGIWEHPWEKSDIVDLVGVPGQGFTEPPSLFDYHYIAVIDGKYYDPSYGTGPYSDMKAWEQASLDGFGAWGFQTDNMQVVRHTFFSRRNTDPAVEVNTLTSKHGV
jgi:hypothetical protein